MKKALAIGLMAAVISGCSSMKSIDDRKTYAQPDWYQECQQAGVKGWFWWKKEFAYACGGGESIHAQAAEEQMYALAMNNFAKRINSEVNSETRSEFKDDKKAKRNKKKHKA